MVIYAWFSGGRDSALSATIAKKVAEIKNEKLILVHIDTTIGANETEEYVRKFSEWINAELIILRPKKAFIEYVKDYPYWPAIYPPRYRWCYYHLKRNVLIEFLTKDENAKNAIHVMGIRKNESLFRESEYSKVFSTKCYNRNLCIKVWLPLLNVEQNLKKN